MMHDLFKKNACMCLYVYVYIPIHISYEVVLRPHVWILLPSPARSSSWYEFLEAGWNIKPAWGRFQLHSELVYLFGWRILYFGNFFLSVTFWNFNLQLRFGLILDIDFHPLFWPDTFQRRWPWIPISRTSPTIGQWGAPGSVRFNPKNQCSFFVLVALEGQIVPAEWVSTWRLKCWKSLIEIVKPPENTGYVFSFSFFKNCFSRRISRDVLDFSALNGTHWALLNIVEQHSLRVPRCTKCSRLQFDAGSGCWPLNSFLIRWYSVEIGSCIMLCHCQPATSCENLTLNRQSVRQDIMGGGLGCCPAHGNWESSWTCLYSMLPSLNWWLVFQENWKELQ